MHLLLKGIARLPELQELLLEVIDPDLQKPVTLDGQETLTDEVVEGADAERPPTSATECSVKKGKIRQPYDVTGPLVAIVAQGKLKKLTVGCYPLVQAAPLCEELKTNTSLQFLHAPYLFAGNEAKLLDVLARYNTNLRQVSTHRDNEKIRHFTTLNFCGRGRARDHSLTRSEFVDLLCGVALLVNSATNASSSNNNGDERGNFTTESILREKHSLLFGLLRESPDQWALEADGTPCVSPNSRKRRRQDNDAALAA